MLWAIKVIVSMSTQNMFQTYCGYSVAVTSTESGWILGVVLCPGASKGSAGSALKCLKHRSS